MCRRPKSLPCLEITFLIPSFLTPALGQREGRRSTRGSQVREPIPPMAATTGGHAVGQACPLGPEEHLVTTMLHQTWCAPGSWQILERGQGTFLVVPWLRICTSVAGPAGSIPDGIHKILHAAHPILKIKRGGGRLG